MNKQYFKLSNFMFILSFWLNFIFSETSQAYTLFIDAGHGGTDRGAVRGQYVESKIALKISNLVVEELSKEKNIRIIQSRNDDLTLGLKERIELADQVNPDLFVSFHVNSSHDERAKGLELYFASKNENQKSESLPHMIVNDYLQNLKLHKSKFAAEKILNEQNKGESGFIIQKRKILQAPFYVLSHSKSPALLIELGFLTHPKEAQLLVSEDYQKQLAQEISRGILKFIN